MKKLTSPSRLAAFLYVLMRDEVPPGRVESLLLKVKAVEKRNPIVYDEPHLSRYAVEMARRLTRR